MTLTGWKLILNKVTWIPQRYVLGIMGLFALANAYTMRVCLNMTITQMVLHTKSSKHIVGETCPDLGITVSVNETGNVTVLLTDRDRYDWDQATQGFLLSSFYYGYVVSHLPGGILAERYGGKWTVGIGLFITSVATAFTPFVVNIGGAVGLATVRILEGLGEGVITPGFMLMLSRWIPPTERSQFGAMIFGGAQIGNIFGPFISGSLLTHKGDWAHVFYVFGGLGLIWCLFWIILCYSTPNTHPFISDEERAFLNANVTALNSHKIKTPIPIKAMIRSGPLWALIIGTVGHAWGYLSMVTDLPKYFYDVLKFNYKETGVLASLPYIVMYVFTLIFAVLCDWGIKKKWHSIGTGRKIYKSLSSSIPAVFIILASYSGCDRVAAVILFVISMGFMAGFYSSLKVNSMDLAPHYAGTCSALANGTSSVCGIIAPYLFGLMTPDQSIGQWRAAFWSVFAVLIGTNIVYLIWGSGEQQWWDDVDKLGYPPDWKHGPLKKKTEGQTLKTKL